MPRHLLSIFVASAVLFSSAYCACVSGAQTAGRGDSHQVVVPQHEGCHGHGSSSEPQDEGSHDCGHCTGTVFADAPTVKSTLSTPLAAPLLFAAPASLDITRSDWLGRSAVNHSGLPPPVPRPTLLSLFCSLSN